MSDLGRTMLQLEHQRCDALLKGDTDALAQLLSERLVFVHANATFDTKASLLQKMAAGTIVYQSLQVAESRVIDQGDTALLFSRLTAAVIVSGNPRSIDNYTLSVWAREQGRWRLLAYQPTPVPKAP